LFDHLEFSFHNLEIGESMSYELDELMLDLGPELRQETLLHLHSELISSMSFFNDKSSDFIVMVVTDLRPRIAYPEDVIIKRGDKADAMFFVNKGRVVVLHGPADSQSNRILCDISAGDYFGEIGCLLNNKRLNTVVAAELTELYSLGRKKVLEIMAEFPAWADEVRQDALERLSNHEREDAHQEMVKQIAEKLQREGSADSSVMDAISQAKAFAAGTKSEREQGGSTNAASAVDSPIETLTLAIRVSEQRILDQLERMQQAQLNTAKQVAQLQQQQDMLAKHRDITT